MSPLRAWSSVAVLGCVGFLAYLDLQIFSVTLQQLKLDLRVTDSQLGLLGGALTGVFAACTAIPIGTLADRYDRRIVLACSMLVWSAATITCGFAHTFAVLSAGAIATAIGESAFVAIIYGTIPELFESRRRTLANTVMYTLLVLSVSLGLYAAGASIGMIDALKAHWAITASRATWRLAFVWAGALGAPVCALLLLVVPGKRRRLEFVAGKGAASPSMKSYLLQQGRFVLSLLFWLGMYRLAANAVQFWMPTVLVRNFGASPHLAGIALGRASLIGTVVGVVSALILLPWILRTRGKSATTCIIATGCSAAGLAAVALMLTRSAAVSLLLCGAIIAVATVTSAVTPGLLQDVSPTHLRSRTIAMYNFVALGPRSLIYYGVGRGAEVLAGKDLKFSVGLVCGSALLAAAIAFALMGPAYRRLMVRLGHRLQPAG